MTKKTIEEQIANNVPGNLDNIIRKHRDKLRFEPATKADLDNLERSISITNLKGVFETAFIYKWVVTGLPEPHLFIVGRLADSNGASGWHTSKILGYDPSTNTALTASGSNYVINAFSDPETDPELLIFICCWMHTTQAGEHFGVPEWHF